MQDDLPPLQAQGSFLSYAADDAVCPGTVSRTEDWVLAVAQELAIDEDQLLPITYYHLDSEAVMQRCRGALGCAELDDGEITIFAAAILDRHELVHALHLSAWPRRQPLLEEGLATVYDDTFPQRFSFVGDEHDASALIEVERPEDDVAVYGVGAYLSYWILDRHGPESLARLWAALAPSTSAEDYRTSFADELDETLAEMLVDVSGQPACQVGTCVGSPKPWVNEVWTMDTPQGCDDDGVVGLVDGDTPLYLEHELVEIAELGTYEISVSAGATSMVACGSSCAPGFGDFTAIDVLVGENAEVVLEPGVYRVEARSSGGGLGDDGVVIRLIQ